MYKIEKGEIDNIEKLQTAQNLKQQSLYYSILNNQVTNYTNEQKVALEEIQETKKQELEDSMIKEWKQVKDENGNVYLA
jgi:hypothetical protein